MFTDRMALSSTDNRCGVMADRHAVMVKLDSCKCMLGILPDEDVHLDIQLQLLQAALYHLHLCTQLCSDTRTRILPIVLAIQPNLTV